MGWRRNKCYWVKDCGYYYCGVGVLLKWDNYSETDLTVKWDNYFGIQEVCTNYLRLTFAFHFGLFFSHEFQGGVDADVEKRFNVSFDKERENREYISGPTNGIHPLANAGGKGIKTVLRETDCKPVDSVPRVFV